MFNLFGCSGHHYRTTNKTEDVEVEQRSRFKRVNPEDEEHSEHERYMELRRDPECSALHIEPVDKRIDTYCIKYKIEKRCKHDGCSKTKMQKMFKTFEDYERFTEELKEVI